MDNNSLGELLFVGGIQKFAQEFRNGVMTSEQLTSRYLEKIKTLDSKFNAYEYLDEEGALNTARAMDLLIQSGTDLGPLMGVPIAIKDVFNIDGMPAPKVGSNLDLSGILGKEEGDFIKALRRSGCVFLGKTKTVEFCLGITGQSQPRGTPWCAADLDNHRLPGGSSSGSAVAVGADLCAFAIGSDSGGSVRVPAAFNGVFGLKTTFGLWPVEGAFPLDPTVDSIGLLTKSAQDALTVFQTLSSLLSLESNSVERRETQVDRLKFGVPTNHFFDEINEDINEAFNKGVTLLKEHGICVDDIVVNAANERKDYFPVTMPAYILAMLGEENFLKQKHLMDPIVAQRVESGLGIKAHDYLALIDRRKQSIKLAHDHISNFDAWISPTTTVFPPLVSEVENPEIGLTLALGMTKNTQPANYLELCAVSLPLPSSGLPIGFQLMAKPNNDYHLLNMAVEIEKIFAANADKLKAI